MKITTLLVVLFLQVFNINSIYAQELYEKVTSTDQISSGDTFILVENKFRYALGNISNYIGTTENIYSNSNGSTATIENGNSEEHPYEITINLENNGYYSLHTSQGYITYGGTSTSIESKMSLNKDIGTWSIDFTSGNGYAKIQNKKSSDRMLKFYESPKEPYFAAYTGSSNVYLFRKMSTDKYIPLQIGAAKYSTLYYSDKSLIVPKGIEAYTFKYNDGVQISKTYKYLDIIPANTAVVLHGQGNYRFLETVANGVSDDNNVLKGTDNKEDISSDDSDYYLYYMLSLNSANELSSVGFYWGADGGGPFINNAHKAYLMIPKHNDSNSKSSFLFSDITSDNTTDISHPIKHETSDSYYTIQGNRISHPCSKGIYIFKGKKRIIIE